LGVLVTADSSVLFTLGAIFWNLYLAVSVHMLLADPGGRIASPRRIEVLAAGYTTSLAGPLPALLFADPERMGCAECPPSAILVRDDATVYGVLDALTSTLAVGLVGYVLYVLVKRWQLATHPQRRAMAPVLWSGICLLVV